MTRNGISGMRQSAAMAAFINGAAMAATAGWWAILHAVMLGFVLGGYFALELHEARERQKREESLPGASVTIPDDHFENLGGDR